MHTKRGRRIWWIAGSLLALTCAGLVWAAYRLTWSFTGFAGRTVWDWLQLLIIPLVLAFGATIINQVNTHTEREIALDKQQEDLLRSYLDKMSELLLEKKLRSSQPDDEVRNIARVRTINTLIQLDVKRLAYVFAFLHEAGLTEAPVPIVSLKDANLQHVKWHGAVFSKANLSEANLSGANLSGAGLRGANLSGAGLRGANLSGANLSRANLRGANLRGALGGAITTPGRYRSRLETDLSEADLSEADLGGADLSGADLSRAIFSGTILKGTKIRKEMLSPEQQAQAIWG